MSSSLLLSIVSTTFYVASSVSVLQLLVEAAKNGLAGKVAAPKAEVKAEAKETVKKETTKKEEVKEDISKLTVAELKSMAKDKGIQGYTTMKKAELLDALK